MSAVVLTALKVNSVKYFKSLEKYINFTKSKTEKNYSAGTLMMDSLPFPTPTQFTGISRYCSM